MELYKQAILHDSQILVQKRISLGPTPRISDLVDGRQGPGISIVNKGPK